MFLHDALFAISTRCSESRGHWQGGSKRAILLRDLRPAAVFSAYLWSSARCLAALGTSPTCEQAGSAGFTVSERIAIGPIACIVTSTDWYASSGTNSDIADRLPSLLRAHQNCDGSGRFCQKMVAIRFHQTRNLTPVHRCERFAPGLTLVGGRLGAVHRNQDEASRRRSGELFQRQLGEHVWHCLRAMAPLLATTVGPSALQGLFWLCPCSPHPQWTRT